MNNFFSQLKREARHVRLTTDEREAMRQALDHAMREPLGVRSPVQPALSPLMFFSTRTMHVLAVVLVVVVVGGSTTYAAEGALPGDLLYPVKTGVNERVVAALAASPEAKAEVHTRLAERRMEEAEVLTERGVLTEDIKENIETRFERHAQRVEEVAAIVEQADAIAAADISERLESSVAAHGAVLERLSEENEEGESRDEARKLARVFQERGERKGLAIARTRAMFSATAESDTAESAVREPDQDFEAAMVQPTQVAVSSAKDRVAAMRIAANASTTLAEVEKRLSALEASLSGEAYIRTKAQIGDIRLRLEGSRSAQDDAFVLEDIRQAFRDAVRLRAFIGAQERFQGRALLPIPEENSDDKSDTESEVEDENADVESGVSDAEGQGGQVESVENRDGGDPIQDLAPVSREELPL